MHDQDLLRLLQPPKHSSTNYSELRKEIGAKRTRARSIISLHCHRVIVDPALPLGGQTQAVTVTSHSKALLQGATSRLNKLSKPKTFSY